ncbi:MAG: DNA repair protein RadC [Gemmatimonadetes bacterium]|nr:DNA repair protein RadC [Gemmatimonadota bacterium]NNF12624.1 DNA repair protein RadC [Gemmatimonadota bacterium]
MSVNVHNTDRPRERLRRIGPRNLTVSELLTLVVGSGSAHGSAVEIAGRIVSALGGLHRLAAADVALLEGVEGVGAATAARLAAAFELGRRVATVDAPDEEPVRGPADVFRRMGPRLRDVCQEEFHALLLNTRHRILREVLVTRGILDASLIHPREVFRLAVSEGAASVILVHNHPSGDPTPSAEDRAVTRQLAAAGRSLGIPVLDHVVIGRGRYVSLAPELGSPRGSGPPRT